MSQSPFTAAVMQTASIPDHPPVTAERSAAGKGARYARPDVFLLNVDVSAKIVVREV